MTGFAGLFVAGIKNRIVYEDLYRTIHLVSLEKVGEYKTQVICCRERIE